MYWRQERNGIVDAPARADQDLGVDAS